MVYLLITSWHDACLVNNHNFKEFFERFGEVIDSVVMIDRATNRHRGFGFVTFQDPTVANTVLSKGNEGKPIPEGGWKQGQLAIFGKMCEVKASEPKKGDSNAEESGGNGLIVSSKSSCSSDTTAGMIPSNIQFQAGYQNTHDSQYGAWSGPAISPLPPNSAVHPPVVLGPVPAPSQLHGYNELNMGQVNPIHYYGNPYHGGMYETYPGAFDQYVYNPYMYPYHGPIYAPPTQYYLLPPGGASEYGSYYSYPAMPQQYSVVPPGMTLPVEGNPQGAAPSFAQEGKEVKAEK
jgi:hypothetical protein